jgi:hypothetical protein
MRPHVMTGSRRNASFMLLALLVLGLAWPRPAKAFCGFYVSDVSDEALLNEASTVILMRDGTHTVLSMQNNYRGPARDFAMVVPVPVVLGEGDVKVLDEGVFDRIDRLSSPRLVEYWERNPCEPEYRDDYDAVDMENPLESSDRSRRDQDEAKARNDTVVVEARFAVGEYAIEILSAENSLGLEHWLHRNGYVIAPDAAELLEPYVQAGSKFLVAKVRARKLRFDRHGRVRLSPLRIHYDSPEFSLPIRLGLINAEGPQDLIVHILAPGLRYETSNYDTVPIPTNVDVEPHTAARFGQFYAALFDRTLAANPGAVVLEYAWGQPSLSRSMAAKCDPCPEGLPGLTFDDLLSLGLDLLPRYRDGFVNGRVDRQLIPLLPGDFVHTRMHARYKPGDRVDDLVFHGTGAAYGGNEFDHRFRRPELSQNEGSRFQARYAIRHAWAGAITCDNPIRGRWDGRASGPVRSASELVFVDRDAELADFISQDELDAIDEHLARGGLPKLRLDADLHAPPPLEPPKLGPEPDGCGHCEANATDGSRSGQHLIGLLVLLLSLALVSRRRRAGARD